MLKLLGKGILLLVVVMIISGVISNYNSNAEWKAEQSRVAALTPAQREAEVAQKTRTAALQAKHAAAKKAAEDEQARADLRALVLARTVKRSAHDPASFQLESAFITKDGSIALEFRAKNGFGGLVKNYAVMVGDKAVVGDMDKVATMWNKHIAEKPGRDVSSFVRMNLKAAG